MAPMTPTPKYKKRNLLRNLVSETSEWSRYGCCVFIKVLHDFSEPMGLLFKGYTTIQFKRLPASKKRGVRFP